MLVFAHIDEENMKEEEAKNVCLPAQYGCNSRFSYDPALFTSSTLVFFSWSLAHNCASQDRVFHGFMGCAFGSKYSFPRFAQY
jgi:hypothetical protein